MGTTKTGGKVLPGLVKRREKESDTRTLPRTDYWRQLMTLPRPRITISHDQSIDPVTAMMAAGRAIAF
ncbi:MULTISPECIES: hypothetical protein [Cyanophyceae]|uniref:hypothetical protein n=1 Tax=Cyanophyceae TaxID=3028117 RepID=UPI001689B2B1|nr:MULTISPECIES: hypothetical protein [Cyanophyceae]MBD1914369.1 hypothetical protein [Phormidium sp. FACHB-77]MBD2028647.1 hypothetical protein [Phormidium sp. FACHB-322]MBD2053659.1 hypothetical protein [Leptolyngbya sp. FACHB-60]